ncbi:g217 [Coccomyxa viridis]|uniref:Tyrosine--tRNA ligase n=1 Tax=Coccomyxa viridis TaxID=1274662 RepID=A0ABP1FF73_9CHLO
MLHSCYWANAAIAAAKTSHAESSSENVIQLLRARGLIQDTTNDALEKVAGSETLSVYCGFDPTAESLHLGNLLGIIVLTWFQRCGHRPVALLGGATGRVGDPSGRSTERPVLSEEEIERNVRGIKRILEQLITSGNGAGPAPQILNNLDWFQGVGLLTFLRDVGKYARVGTMLSRDAVKSRMELDNEGISYTEFTYQLLQGYDFVHLNREHGVRMQIGGSDQMGNIITGLELIRRMNTAGESPSQEACFGLTFPLLTKADGTKMGKSAGGAIWLAADRLSPFKFYQYLLTNVGDAEIMKFLRMLTFVPLEELETLEASMHEPGYRPNTAQRLLAAEVTRFVHGQQGLDQALKATEALAPGSDTALDAETLEAVAESAPSVELHREQVVGQPLTDVMVAIKLQDSKAAARRLIKGGGVRLNNVKVESEQHVLSEEDLIEGRLVLIAAGKKNKMLVRIGS